MKIVSEKTELMCIKEIDNIEKDPFGFRALLIKLSVIQNKNVRTIRDLVQSLTDIFRNQEVKVFIFSDHDLLLIYQGMTLSLLDDIYAKVKQLTSEDALKITQIFDLEKNSGVVKNICHKKIEMAELEKKAIERSITEANKEVSADYSNAITEMVLDSKLLNTLSERKEKNYQTKILLIEDDAFSRRLVKKILEKDFDVVEADSGKDALLKYVAHAPNLVFLDINLPDCSGMSLLEKLISIDKRSYVVMLSGNAFKDNIVLSIQKGAKGFVGKPFPKEKILHYVEKYNSEKTA